MKRILKSATQAACADFDQPADPQKKAMEIAERSRIKGHDLETLVDGITNENMHKPIDMGPPVGREIW